MRLFVGIAMAAELADELAGVRARLERPGDGLRWSAREGWHITLQFLGSVTEEQCACVVSRLRGVRCGALRVRLEGLGFFDRAGVFFTDVVVSPELVALQKEVMGATGGCGFKAEERPYHPHITLARNKGREDGVRRLKTRVGNAPEFGEFLAREFLLYESFPGASGSRYEVRERFGLVG